MRRLAALLTLSLLLAAPAGAQEGRRLQAVKEAPASALRGPAPEEPVEQPGADMLLSLTPLPPPVAPVGSKTVSNARTCRAACSRAYYVCLSSADDICPQVWTRCASGCGT